MYQEDYLFAKVGICADRYSWFGCPLPSAPVSQHAPDEQLCKGDLSGEESQAEQPRDGSLSCGKPDAVPSGRGNGGNDAAKSRESWFGRRRQMRARRREQRRQQQEYLQKCQEYEEQREELACSIRQLWKEVFSEVERAGGMDEVRCVYESSLRFLADGRGEAALCWRQVWNVPEFHDYKSIRWVRPLLEYVRHSDFILLGTADCIPAILQKLARQMKSLQWCLREEELSEEVQGWIEDFYEEYGLAVTLRELTGGNAFRQLKLKSAKPVCVMDFTDEGKLFAGNLAEGSVWLDFAAVEEKSERMNRQAPGISYISLKKYWGAKTKRKPVFPVCGTGCGADVLWNVRAELS